MNATESVTTNEGPRGGGFGGEPAAGVAAPRAARGTDGLVIGLAVAAAAALLLLGVVVGTGRRGATADIAAPHLTSMEESARAMQRAGAAMEAHGQTMVAEGQRTGDRDLIDRGAHWVDDAQTLAQRGRWMAMNPAAPASLLTPTRDLVAQGTMDELARTAQAMLHDPSKARSVDLDALRWNGEAMAAEGRNMAEHGRIMREEVEQMVTRHGLSGPAAAELREAAQTMLVVGGHLSQNGQEMVDYAIRLRRSLGYR